VLQAHLRFLPRDRLVDLTPLLGLMPNDSSMPDRETTLVLFVPPIHTGKFHSVVSGTMARRLLARVGGHGGHHSTVGGYDSERLQRVSPVVPISNADFRSSFIARATELPETDCVQLGRYVSDPLQDRFLLCRFR
jgi:hypothetical protein